MERGRHEHDAGSISKGRARRDLEVHVGYDRQSSVYYIVSSDIPGLNIETATFESLVEVAIDAAPDLIEGLDRPTRINFRWTVDLLPDDGR